MKWITINDNDNYEINELGCVRHIRTLREKKHTVASNGYKVVVLYKSNVCITHTIHRLLAKAFIENKENSPTVNHIDGNKLNNYLSNLEWTTYGKNNKHAYEKGLKIVTNKMMETAKKLNAKSLESNPFGANRKKVALYKDEFYKEFENVKMASEYIKCHRASIDRVLKGKKQKVKGYFVKYI